MTLEDLLRARHSCRAFLPDPVPPQMIDAILALAQQTPSWCNTQPWRLTITGEGETDAVRAGLAEFARSGRTEPDIAFPEAYVDDANERRRTTAWQLYDAVGIEWGDRERSAQQTLKNFDLFGAPHLAIITTDAQLGAYGAVDCGLYVQTFLLAATSLGVATVPQAAIAMCAPYLRERYGYPEDREVLCGISFGFADTDHPANSFRTERASLADVAELVTTAN